jgi:uncharacterized protein
MVQRTFWLKLLESARPKKSIIYISGVRGTGKTSLCQNIPGIEYLDCQTSGVRRHLEKPASFFEQLKSREVVLDDIHLLPNFHQVLQILADRLPSLKIIMTGSLTFEALSRSDETQLKKIIPIWLLPIMSRDLIDFGNTDLPHRFLRGGLPSFFLSREMKGKDFQDWMDSLWAKDIQEQFRLERRSSLQRFMEMLFRQSGDLFEATRFAAPCEVSRPTIRNYLSALESLGIVYVLPPFTTRRSTEIVSAPKAYAFDTGLICHFRGWNQLRQDDFSLLWRHWVLNEILSLLQSPRLLYWQDKRGHEVDFILIQRDHGLVALQCEWKADDFDPANLKAFRNQYPGGENWIVCQDVDQTFSRSYNSMKVEFISLEDLDQRLG